MTNAAAPVAPATTTPPMMLPNPAMPVAQPAAAGPVTIAGKWSWHSGLTAEFQSNGTAKLGNSVTVPLSNGLTAQWTCLNQRARKYQAAWSDGTVDWMLLSPDGSILSCSRQNTNGMGPWTARRLPADAQK